MIVPLVAALLHVQSLPVSQPPRPIRPCDGRLALVTLTVVDARGQPVRDAVVTVTRARGAHRLPGGDAVLAETGQYLIVDDGALPSLDAAGERVLVRVARGDDRRDVVLRIGHSANGCHVRRIDGPERVVLRRS